MKLYDLAHSRTGDKGNLSTISVIAYDKGDYDHLVRHVTEQAVERHFAPAGVKSVRRYQLPRLGALNFVLDGVLGGGVTRSLAIDAHGKALSGWMLELELPDKEERGTTP